MVWSSDWPSEWRQWETIPKNKSLSIQKTQVEGVTRRVRHPKSRHAAHNRTASRASTRKPGKRALIILCVLSFIAAGAWAGVTVHHAQSASNTFWGCRQAARSLTRSRIQLMKAEKRALTAAALPGVSKQDATFLKSMSSTTPVGTTKNLCPASTGISELKATVGLLGKQKAQQERKVRQINALALKAEHESAAWRNLQARKSLERESAAAGRLTHADVADPTILSTLHKDEAAIQKMLTAQHPSRRALEKMASTLKRDVDSVSKSVKKKQDQKHQKKTAPAPKPVPTPQSAGRQVAPQRAPTAPRWSYETPRKTYRAPSAPSPPHSQPEGSHAPLNWSVPSQGCTEGCL